MSVQAQTLKDQLNPVLDITNYWQHYGLTQDPFAISGDDGIYFSPTRWEEYLDLLQYLSHHNNVLLAMTGCSGSGKSTLKNQFISKIKESMHVCQLSADSALNIGQLVELLGAGFSLPWDTEETLEDQLDIQLAKLREREKPSLLVIDNAHLLPTDTQRSLLSLINRQAHEHVCLHILLCGEPQLQASLARISIAEGYENLVHALFLDALTLEETDHYLQYRLKATGLAGEFPLSAQAVARISKLSEGVPGRINRIARRTLLNALVRQQDTPPNSFFRLHQAKFMGSLLLVAVLGGATTGLNWLYDNDRLGRVNQLFSAFSSKLYVTKPATVETVAMQSSQPDVAATDNGAINPAQSVADQQIDITPKLAAALENEANRLAEQQANAMTANNPTVADNAQNANLAAYSSAEKTSSNDAAKPVLDAQQPSSAATDSRAVMTSSANQTVASSTTTESRAAMAESTTASNSSVNQTTESREAVSTTTANQTMASSAAESTAAMANNSAESHVVIAAAKANSGLTNTAPVMNPTVALSTTTNSRAAIAAGKPTVANKVKMSAPVMAKATVMPQPTKLVEKPQAVAENNPPAATTVALNTAANGVQQDIIISENANVTTSSSTEAAPATSTTALPPPAAAPSAATVIQSQEARIMSGTKHPVGTAKKQNHHPAQPSADKLSSANSLSGSKNNYVLQLMGLSKKQAAEEYIAQHSIKGLTYVHTYLQGKNWYVVIYGQYKSSQDAQYAAQHLPKNLKNAKPWPRTLASIRAATHQPG